ncbi:MAG TPA: hypothetical protein VK400_20160 [Pyrinomonadaceae bacterium]|nr:hypothetical protein [Pyrinomonadaceae bacterium]
MNTKGVDFYGFLSSASDYALRWYYPSGDASNPTTVFLGAANKMYQGACQITGSNISGLYGRFEWDFLYNMQEVAESNFASINPYTGNIDDVGMCNMLSTPSIVKPEYAVSYGFYDAGTGLGGLPNNDQSYVYVTENYSNWMGNLAKQNPLFGKLPFTSVALPGAHDAGTFDPTKMQAMLQIPGFVSLISTILGPIFKLSSEFFLATAIGGLERLLTNFGFTQKDDITTMLNLGVRYFDFRPGYCATVNEGELYHQHKFIPGYPYISFLEDILTFLKNNPTEIVVVNLNFQNFYSPQMQPLQAVLDTYLANAMTATGTTDSIGYINGNTLTSTNISYSGLIADKTRLIFLNQLDGMNDASKCDSYDKNVYRTTDVTQIINHLSDMTSSQQKGTDYTVLQLQSTAQAVAGGIWSNIATLSDASSPLLATKAMFDHQTYPWLLAHVANMFMPNQNIVFLNDFADNALVNAAIEVTNQRLANIS